MGSWEVAHSLRDQALTTCGSEATVDIEGYVYAPALALLRDESADASATDLAMDLASGAVTLGGEWTHSAMDDAALGAWGSAPCAWTGGLTIYFHSSISLVLAPAMTVPDGPG